ncbi:MAG: hypothetical protein ACFFDR_09850, partial [Candidatus Thorarchaeota archaeon]
MDQARALIVTMILSILIFPGVVVGLVVAGPLTPAQSPTTTTVAVVGAENSPAIIESLEIDTSAIILNEFSSIASALSSDVDVLILIDVPIHNEDLLFLNSHFAGGGGLFILTGPEMTANTTGFSYFNITTSNSLTSSVDNAGVVTRMMDSTHPIMSFDWSSAPAAEKITILPQLTSASTVLLANDTGFGTGGVPLLVHTSVGSGNILVYTPWLTLNSSAENPQTNYELILWPYFNYFLYSSSVYLSDQSPLTYAEWSYSPIPHFEQQMIIGVLVAVIGIVTATSYRSMKKRSLEKKEILSEIERAELLIEVTDEVDEWEEVGMHRQIGGFLIQLFLTLILVIPRVVLTIMIYPRFIMPFPTAAGWYSFSVNLFLGLWTLFDLGTSVALAKYFAEYRVEQPEEAV